MVEMSDESSNPECKGAGILRPVIDRRRCKWKEDCLRVCPDCLFEIAQLEDATTSGSRRAMVVFVLMGAVWPTAILYVGMRVNGKSLSDVSGLPVVLLILCFWLGARRLRLSVPPALARKRELEILLKELDGG